MSEYTVVSLVPQLLNIHGDAQNAQVLAARAHWAGHDARVVEIHSESEAEGVRPDAITIGSGFDSDAEELLHMLESLATCRGDRGGDVHYRVLRIRRRFTVPHHRGPGFEAQAGMD